ncbi:MAG TPA: RNA polymerase sigma factor [Cytophagales bacterium]|jgi:RNA polymerase sigma factor (sigma-70 family)
MTPFSQPYDETEDRLLVQQAREGSRLALERLVKRHQRFIYNVALKFARDPDEAADLTQEVLIKMVTKLSSYQGNSSLRTWLYRIVVNHFLKGKRHRAGTETLSFEAYGQFLDQAHDGEAMTPEEHLRYQEQIVRTRNACMTGMLLCLDRTQRMVFILGAIFNLRSPVAARILDISPDNFRQQLSRAKADLFQFMDNKCGLMNPANPCRCAKKTKGFIGEGKVDAGGGQFTAGTVATIREASPGANRRLDALMEGKYLHFFLEQPYERHEAAEKLVSTLLFDQEIKDLFRLN